MKTASAPPEFARFAIGFDQRDRVRLHELIDEVLDSNRWSEASMTERFEVAWQEWNDAPAVAVVNYVPAVPSPLPIRTWQVWNEANFFYFAYPVSPSSYARLLKPTRPEKDDPNIAAAMASASGRLPAPGNLSERLAALRK